MANTYLSRTLGTPTNRKICTFSHWVKMSDINHDIGWFGTYNSGNNFRWGMMTAATDGAIDAYEHNGSAYVWRRKTNRRFKDTSAWYHLMLVLDTTQSTAGDRVKIYINGVQETSFSSSNDPGLNIDLPYANSAITHYVGKHNTEYFDGYMSHVHFIDGTAYDATAFGEFDANGVWKIKTSPSVTYGTNGFFILKNGNSVTDQSGNSNNFTVAGGTLTNTEDNPSNVFATLNPLIASSIPTYSNGNLTIAGASTWESSPSTLAVSSGLWYAEFKDVSGSNNMVGVENAEIQTWITQFPGYSSDGWGYARDGGKRNSGSDTAYGSSFTSGDIISIALDMDNKFVYFAKNGTWQNSGDPTSGATGTGGLSLSANEYYFVTASYNSSSSANFGNGYFGATAISSAGTNASGIGIFEHDVPTGYTALSTKGLNL